MTQPCVTGAYNAATQECAIFQVKGSESGPFVRSDDAGVNSFEKICLAGKFAHSIRRAATDRHVRNNPVLCLIEGVDSFTHICTQLSHTTHANHVRSVGSAKYICHDTRGNLTHEGIFFINWFYEHKSIVIKTQVA